MKTSAARTATKTAPGSTSAAPITVHPIVFIDGECVVCEGSMQMIYRFDKRGLFRFAPLQGPTAARLLDTMSEAELLDGVVLYENGRLLQGYPAVLRISALLYPYLAWAVALLRLPGIFALGRLGYRVIVRNRYKWFGKKTSCMMPTGDIRARILD